MQSVPLSQTSSPYDAQVLYRSQEPLLTKADKLTLSFLKREVKLLFENDDEISSAQPRYLPVFSKFVPAEEKLLKWLNTSWSKMAEQIAEFVKTRFRSLQNGCYGRVNYNENSYFTGFVMNRLPVWGSMVIDGDSYTGSFNRGLPHNMGQVKIYGTTLEVSFINGQPNGFGTICFEYEEKQQMQVTVEGEPYEERIFNTEEKTFSEAILAFFSSAGTFMAPSAGTLPGLLSCPGILPLCRKITIYHPNLGYFDGACDRYGPIFGELQLLNYSYQGQFKNRVPHGSGVEQTPGHIYEGMFHNGNRHGQGTQLNINQGLFEGNYFLGNARDKGVLNLKNGDKYKGDFEYGFFSGYGAYEYASGEFYEGEFKKHARNGTGTFYYTNGGRYSGEHASDKLHGNGKLIIPNYIYTGQLENDRGCGLGKLVVHTDQGEEARLEGTFVDSALHGQGKAIFDNGSTYQGYWKNGQFFGRGTFQRPNGDVYSGQWEHNALHGVGTKFVKATRTLYKSEWSRGYPYGKVTITHPNGKIEEGHYQLNEFEENQAPPIVDRKVIQAERPPLQENEKKRGAVEETETPERENHDPGSPNRKKVKA